MKHIILLIIMMPLFLISAEPSDIELSYIVSRQEKKQNDQLQKTLATEKSLNEMISYIDIMINKQFPRTFSFASTRKEAHHLAIINTLYTSYPSINPNNDFINKLETKNENFREAISYFSYFAERNKDAVTCDTIKKVEDPTQEQLIPQLNILPLAIKIYLMKKIQESTDCSYDISLKAKSNFNHCDICPERHLMVSYHDDHKVLLYNLYTHKSYDEIITNPAEVTAIAFNPFRSQIAIGQRDKDSTPSIKIVDFETKKTIVELELDTTNNNIEVSCLKFSKINDTSVLLSAFMQRDCSDYTNPIIHEWYISEDNPIYVHSIKTKYKDYSHITRGCYFACNPCFKLFSRSTITITKNKCYQLYLCQQAVKTANQKNVSEITSSKSYQSLTEYEQNMIDQQIQQKLENDKKPHSNFIEIFQWQAK